MTLTKKQKNFIRLNAGIISASNLSRSLDVSEKEINRYTKAAHIRLTTNTVTHPNSFVWRDILVLFVLPILVYMNSLTNDFVSDDVAVIVEGTALKTFPTFSSAVLTIFRSIILYVIYQLFGQNPTPYRLTNIFFHCGSVLVIYFILRRLVNRSTALIAGLFTAVHPVFTEPVVWIIGGVYVQYGFLFLLSFLLYLYRNTSNFAYGSSIFVFILMILTLERSLPLALAFPIYEAASGQFRKNWKYTIPYLLISFCILLGIIGVFKTLESRISYIESRSDFIGLYNPVVQIPIAISTYLRLLIFPATLAFFHSSLEFSIEEYALSIFIFILYILATVLFWRKKIYISFFLILFAISLSPYLTPYRIAWLVAERYAYIAWICTLSALAIIIDSLYRKYHIKKVPILLIIGFILSALFARTYIRNMDWRSQETLYTASLTAAPNDPRVHNNMGNVYKDKHDLSRAKKEYEIASQLSSKYAPAQYNLGILAYMENDFISAYRYFQKALEFDPAFVKAHEMLASLYFEEKMYDKSLAELNNVLKLEPENILVHINFASTYLKLGQKDKARESLKKALEIDPQSTIAIDMLKKL